mgnify:CR=1 FL=1
MIAQVAAVLLPVFCIAGLGYVWRLTGVPFDLPFVTRVIMYVAGPCLVFDSLSKLKMPLGEFGAMVGATIALTLLVALIAFLLLKAMRLSLASFLPALTLGNTGNLGLPLCLFAFGDQGLGLAVAVYVTNSVLQFTFVPLLQTRAPILRTLLTTPIIYGALACLAHARPKGAKEGADAQHPSEPLIHAG